VGASTVIKLDDSTQIILKGYHVKPGDIEFT
jgi:hypothetical protein